MSNESSKIYSIMDQWKHNKIKNQIRIMLKCHEKLFNLPGAELVKHLRIDNHTLIYPWD